MTTNRILVELVFRPTSEGGRETLPDSPPNPHEFGGYMPHVIVDRSDNYLGVKFYRHSKLEFGVPSFIELLLMYSEVDYSALQPSVSIEVREGKKTVAIGRVICHLEPVGRV